MEWRDEGVILGTRRHGETSAIVEVMTCGHGRHMGMVRGGAPAVCSLCCNRVIMSMFRGGPGLTNIWELLPSSRSALPPRGLSKRRSPFMAFSLPQHISGFAGA